MRDVATRTHADNHTMHVFGDRYFLAASNMFFIKHQQNVNIDEHMYYIIMIELWSHCIMHVVTLVWRNGVYYSSDYTDYRQNATNIHNGRKLFHSVLCFS